MKTILENKDEIWTVGDTATDFNVDQTQISHY